MDSPFSDRNDQAVQIAWIAGQPVDPSLNHSHCIRVSEATQSLDIDSRLGQGR
jgi:hypothetical protein